MILLPVVSEDLLIAIAEGNSFDLKEAISRLVTENPQLVLLADNLTKLQATPLTSIATAYSLLHRQAEVDWLKGTSDAKDSDVS